MTLQIKHGGMWQTVVATKLYVRTAGSWTTVTHGYVKKDGIWYEFFPVATSPPPPDAVLTLTLDKTTDTQTITGAGVGTSATITGTAASGTPAYTYSWSYISGDMLTVTSPSAAATTFSYNLPIGTTKSGVYRLTVTDAEARIATKDVTITLVSIRPNLSIVLSPSPARNAFDSSPFRYSEAITANVAAGGNGSYTYEWTVVSKSFGGANNVAIGGPSQSIANMYTYIAWCPGSCVLRCTVTDTAGAQGYADVTVSLPA